MTTSTMAVVFCDVVSSTEVRDRLGDTQADAWFGDLLRRVGDAVVDANGSVVKSLGDGVMAVFTSAGAALEAAVAMQQASVAHGWAHPAEPARLRVGVSIGDVSASTDDGVDDWNGMPVVEAARLCGAAQPDEILATEVVRVMVGSRSDHEITALGEYSLKGISSPVPVVRVGWDRPSAGPESGAAAIAFPEPLAVARRGPFAGRTVVVAELLDTWKAEEWRGLLVAGEPGIGKTRLVSELTKRMYDAGATVLLGRCDEDLAVGFRPWMEALAPLVAALSADDIDALAPEHVQELSALAPDLRRRIGDAGSKVELDAASRTAVLCDAIGVVLRDAAPVVVVLDDIHWIDQASLIVARQVIGRAIPNVTVIGTYRDTDLDRVHPLSAALADLRRVDGVRRVALGGLDEAGVSDFLEAAAGHELDPAGRELADAVYAQTSGNPLFVGEVLRHLAETGAIAQENDRWVASSRAIATALPEGLREVIGRRLTRLGDGTTQALRVGAVFGRSFEADLVDAVLGRDTLDDIEHAVAAGIVIDTGRAYEFRHAVIRDVLLDELSTARRRRMHRDIVTVLEQRWALSIDRHLEELAYHHGEAQSPAAPAWYLRAAETAYAAFDGRSGELVERGLELLDLAVDDDPVLRCDLLAAQAEASLRVNFQESLGAARVAFEAARALGDQSRMARALCAAGMSATSDAGDERGELLRAGLAYISDTSLVARWRVEAFLLQNEVIGPRLTAAEHVERVDAIARHLNPFDDGAAKVGVDMVIGLTFMSSPQHARKMWEQFGRASETGSSYGYPMDAIVGQVALTLGDRGGFDRGLEVALSHEQLRRTSWSYNASLFQIVAMRDMLDGNWADAEAAVAEVARLGGHDMNFALGCHTQRTWMGRETGEAESVYQLSLALAAAMADFPAARAVLVSDAAEAGHVGHVLALLDELAPDDFAAVGRGWLTVLVLGDLAWGVVTAEAAEHAAVLRRLLGPYGGQMAHIASGTHVMCSIDRLLAGLAAVDGDHAEADRLFAAALAQEEALRAPTLAARTKQWWGRALARRGDIDRARPLLAAARADAESLGMLGVVVQIGDLTANVPSVGD